MKIRVIVNLSIDEILTVDDNLTDDEMSLEVIKFINNYDLNANITKLG
jgi:hypothetical protein